MSDFRVQFSIDGADFDNHRDMTIAAILRRVADEIDASAWARDVRDSNGNRIGDYGIRLDGSLT